MAFPWLQQETWDDGTRGNFDAETDASSILDFPDYRELARGGFSPWQGAHALRLRLNGTATANIQENDGFDTAAAGVIHLWMPWLIGADLRLADTEAVILFALQSAGPVNEVVFGVRNNGGVYELFCGETGATRTLAITRSNTRWYQIEIRADIDNAGSNDGTIDFYVDGAQVGAQITALDQGAITQAQLGAVSGTAAGQTGTILCGGVIADDARVFPRRRFPDDTIWITRDMNAFVGPCTLDTALITGTGTDAVLALYDTDVYDASGIDFSREPVVYVRNVTANDQAPGFNTPVQFRRGVYAVITGTAPQAWVSIREPSAVVKSGANYVGRGLRGR